MKKIKYFINILFFKIIKLYEKLIRKLYFYKTPVNSNTIVFESEGDYCDNARALYEYMILHKYNQNYNIIWIVNDVETYKNINKNIKNVYFVSRNNKSIKNLVNFYKLIGSGRIFFFTHPYWFTYKKDEQIIINLWHGTPLKSGGRDISNAYDYAIIPSKGVLPWFEKFIGVKDKQVIFNGSPRNDLLFENKKVLSKIINVNKEEKSILLMPTFRQSLYMKDSDIVNPFVIQNITSEKELSEFNKYLKENKIKLIIKIHHLQLTNFLENTKLSNIIYIQDKDLNKKNIQLYNLVGECDALLTDYSSIYFDYLLLNRPIGFLIGDIDDYKKNRGFIVDKPEDYMPGMKIKSLDDLYLFLENIINNIDQYKEERKKILYFSNDYQINNNSEILLEKVLKIRK